MSPRDNAAKWMILDSCVLIDFVQADASVLRLIADYVGPIHVLNVILEEVRQIESEDELADLGLVVIEPAIDDAFAAARTTGQTSFQDRLCMLTARRHRFSCVTNDMNLRKLCEQERVPSMWGLQLIAELHRAEGISGKYAEKLAQAIHISNPKHITDKIISRFLELIQRQENGRSRQNY